MPTRRSPTTAGRDTQGLPPAGFPRVRPYIDLSGAVVSTALKVGAKRLGRHVTHYAHRALPKYRYLRSYRRGENHRDGAYFVLYRRVAQNRRGPRRRGRHGLHGTGTGTRHHHHRRGHHLFLEGNGQELPRAPHQHHRYPGTRRFYDRSGTLIARAGFGHRRVLRGLRRAAAVRNGLAPDEQVRGPAHRLRQQDGSRRREFPALRRADQNPSTRQSRADSIADRRRGWLHRRGRSHQDEGHPLGRGNPGHEIRISRHSGSICARNARNGAAR